MFCGAEARALLGRLKAGLRPASAEPWQPCEVRQHKHGLMCVKALCHLARRCWSLAAWRTTARCAACLGA